MQSSYFFLSYFQDITQGPGEGTYTDHTLEIIIMLLVAFILGYLLRYFIGRKWVTLAQERKARMEELERDLEACRKRSNEMEEQLSSARYDIDQLNEKVRSLRSQNASLDIQLKACKEQQAAGMVAAAAAPADTKEDTGIARGAAPSGRIDYNAAFKEANLQIIEGIGPKMESILHENGIDSWRKLADTSVDRLRTILDENKLKFAKPDSWPQQAEMAAKRDWEKLAQFQREYDPNSNTVGNETDAKIEKMAARILGITLYKPDDLKVVEGIGPKIEGLLKADGINNWTDLAKASVDELQSILNDAGDSFRMAVPDTWPKQAQLAADGKWLELDEYQEFLDGGKEPE